MHEVFFSLCGLETGMYLFVCEETNLTNKWYSNFQIPEWLVSTESYNRHLIKLLCKAGRFPA